MQCSDFLSGSRHRWHLPPLRTNTDTLSTQHTRSIWAVFTLLRADLAYFCRLLYMYFHHQQVHAYRGIPRNEHISTLGTCRLRLDNCTRLMLTIFTSASQQLLYVIIIWRDNELCRSLQMVDTAQSVQSVPSFYKLTPLWG